MAVTDFQNLATNAQPRLGTLGLFGRLRDYLARRALYRRTVAELRQLNDRELNDLGLHRSMITRVASKAAWGQ
ncbi:MAG: DUF1127 domain-containing protein [Paracoccus sp. (in: a-proteobacteria)]|nr:DUF1127 domain-containing protein [Paracoccus sp. (in: a-proteobacteria)]